MRKENLFSLLKSFSAEEFRSFGRFLDSPYLNNSYRLVPVYSLLKPYHPRFNKNKLTREFVYEMLYKNKSYNDNTMRELYSEMISAVQKFYAYEKFGNETVRQEVYSLRALSANGETDLYQKNLNRVRNKIENNHELDPDYFLDKFEIDSAITDHRTASDRTVMKNSLKGRTGSMEKSVTDLSIHFYMQVCRTYYKKYLYAEKFSSTGQEEFQQKLCTAMNMLKGFIASDRKYSFLLEIYDGMINLLKSPDETENYFICKECLYRHLDKLGGKEKFFHFAVLINHCIYRGNRNDSSFDAELFSLYELVLDKQYYKNDEDKYLNVSLFRAVLLLSFRLGRYSWAEEFVELYSKHLHPVHRENIRRYALAMLRYEQDRKDESLPLIKGIDISNFILKYDLYSLELKIQYEKENYNCAQTALNNAYNFMKKDKFMAETNKINYRNFLKYYRKLLNATSQKHKTDFIYHSRKMYQERNLSHSKWLYGMYSAKEAQFSEKRMARV